MLVHDFLRRSAAAEPHRTALVDPARSVCYADLDRYANRVAQALIQRGVSRGERVLLALENSIEWVASYFGILKAGAVAVPVATGTKSDRLGYALDDCEPVAAILDANTAGAEQLERGPLRIVLVHGGAADTASRSSLKVIDYDRALSAADDSDPDVRCIDLDLAAILYTSGSTGTPRGVMLSHLNFVANTESIVSYLGLGSVDRVMVVLPFYYVYGLSLLQTHISVGGSLAIENRFAFPNVALNAMREHAVTGFAGVPSTFALLLHRSGISHMTFPALRYMTQAGGAMAPALIQEWRRTIPDVRFYVMYGATEAAGRLTYLDPAELERRLGSIGRAIPNVELLVLRDDGEPAATGEVGEIVARGANISGGYWNAPEATRASFGPQGYRTGDLAFADGDGFLYVVGRRHDFLKVGAHRVGAKEIEDALHEHPAVHEVAVVPASDELLGEVPVAFVSLRDDHLTDATELLAFCRGHLPEHKVPGRIIFTPEIPKSAAGKIDKRALRQAVVDAVAAP